MLLPNIMTDVPPDLGPTAGIADWKSIRRYVNFKEDVSEKNSPSNEIATSTSSLPDLLVLGGEMQTIVSSLRMTARTFVLRKRQYGCE
jgi:hypothetical protein